MLRPTLPRAIWYFWQELQGGEIFNAARISIKKPWVLNPPYGFPDTWSVRNRLLFRASRLVRKCFLHGSSAVFDTWPYLICIMCDPGNLEFFRKTSVMHYVICFQLNCNIEKTSFLSSRKEVKPRSKNAFDCSPLALRQQLNKNKVSITAPIFGGGKKGYRNPGE